MPRIKIIKAPKSKVRIVGLPKADVGMQTTFQTTETTTIAPGTIPTISFKNDLNDIAPPEMSSEEMLQSAKDKNYQNWMQNPQNEMSTASWASDFNEKFFGPKAQEKYGAGKLPQYDPSKFYDEKGKEITSGSDDDSNGLNWRQKFGKWAGKTASKINKTLEEPANIANNLQNIIGIGGAAADFITNQKEAKANEAWMRRQLNKKPINTIMDRGDYVSNTGDFRPGDEVTNPGMYNSKFYGQYGSVKYGGQPYFAGGGGFESVITPDVIPTYSINTPVITPTLVENAPAPTASSAPVVSTSKKGDVATRTNNPGNLLYTPVFGKLFGAVDSGIKQIDGTGHFAAFPTVQAGLNAREAQMFGAVDGTFNTKIYKPTITVDQALRKWSNNGYGGNIYPEIANKTLAEVTPEERKELLKRQVKAESGSMYKKLKEEGIFANGGENNNNMKIRIVGTPDENHMAEGGQPQYSGQSNYGLYIGQRDLYRTMGKNPYKDTGDTVKEEDDSDSPYVLEAEGGETIFRPDGTHMNISGPRHSSGGVKLNEEQAPEGSFIFSDTKKMRIGGAILANFGKSKNDKNKYTPAELAKQYPVNKYRAILEDPNADPMSKDTAKIMVNNYLKKLSELSLVQEGMKGFPQGIPKIAEGLVGQQQQQNTAEAAYGGMYAFGGPLDKFIQGGPGPKKVPKADISKYEKEGYVQIPGTTTWRKGTKTIDVKDPTVVKGSGSKAAVPGTPPQKDTYRGPKMSNADWLKFLQTAQGQKYKEKYITGTPGTPEVAGTPDETTCPTGYTLNTTTGKCEKIAEGEDLLTYEEDVPPPKVPPGTIPPVQKFNAGRPPFFSYDMFIAPQREQVFAAEKRNTIPRPVFKDPTRELAESSGMAKTMMAGYQGPVQGYSTNAMASQLQAAENAGNILARYQNDNVGIGNEFAKLQAGLINEEEAYNADRADKLFFNTEQTKKANRSNLAKYLGKAGQIAKNNYGLNTNVNAMNAMHPYFNFNFGPRGMNISQKPGTDWYGMVTGRAASSGQKGAAPTAQQYLKTINELKTQYPNASPAQINTAYSMMFPTAKATGGGKAAAAYANQAMSMMPYAANNGMYGQQGYDIGDLYDQDE